ncbi:MAG TPA: tetraacyldisaccharide 4'-kinase [Thermoanaerobaculia bacterium]
MNPLTAPFEFLYRAINRARRTLYRSGLLDGKRLRRPVVSIGNIAAGGTGKTPAVIALCRHLDALGLRVVVLTRGYGRKTRHQAGEVRNLDVDKYGDEPVLIKSRTGATILVSSNRYDAATHYLRDNDCDLFVLDDGFQHLQLQRDLDIVIDAPARFFREGRSALQYADHVIPRRLRTLVPPELLTQKVYAFSALADNEQFFASLRAAGVQLCGTRGFRDHHRYTAADLEAMRAEARGATLVTTEKDAVKIDDRSVIAVPAEFEIDPAILEQVAELAANPERRKKRRRKNLIVQKLEYAAYRLVNRLVQSISEETAVRWGRRLGSVARHVLRRRDRLAMKNLTAAFPQRDRRELRRILNDCWRHFGREVLQVLQLRNLSLDEVALRCPVGNTHLIDESSARGRGTVLISAHWGGWEIAGLAIMAAAKNIRTVARPLDNELMEQDLQRLRAHTGARVVDRRKAARVLMRGLSENAVVVLLPDQAVKPREGVLVPFLGRPAWTTDAPAKLALRSGASIVFGFCITDGLGHRFELEGPIRADLLTGAERDPVELTKRINDVISRRIVERPELWLWMHDRWKGTEESEAAE